ncbi:unnamed protein product [Arabidopsis lyrata]|uniref:LEAF RUST 10 DISEASE-RESISTANCE LOCUS RECEPTOR-LIKE PROTEIN KINASE-like 2.5 n=1 Tax=Arabidopsis lyrata subsp. lyrata TaxID=81972 RepID=UPI000A29BB2F|nr:LEAF RUST 10 DISEASE-RESISTANCE LOCUS RECEPTOR-LIKE PROTEIN KINASE-like 2.5 [Arabidopsis lyrata subsp. lyrata]CAH8257284.1 unnamed protein product [Arabidopsis lyrata]|eukprot:XP_020865821.1 LEAF RUST 10 DISEASE-RESISTANCE LOCUS RECEPTOR-LIKE PROTEIN KINASE-like 2.5 [Arabidopsis lyrata subsp. lyrata]
MYHLPTSCLFFFFFPFFSLFHHFPHVSSKQELGWCESQFQCGNITAGFPFSGGIRPQICGHPSLELHCFNNHTSIIISDHLYNVLHIDQTSNTLRLARAELQGSFFNASFTATTLPYEIFELSYRSSYTCPDSGLVSVSQNLDYHDSCNGSFTINAPKSFVPEEKELNMSNLESALREGFEVKVKTDEKACQKCSSSQGICGFENTTQVCCKESSSSVCDTLHATELELHRRCGGPFSCGDQSELFYPFWKSGSEDCGLPDYKLDCSGGIANYVSGIKTLATNYVSLTLSTDNLKEALEEGFEADCQTCIHSKGACGYTQTPTSSGFVCYYMEEPQNPTRNKDAGLSNGAKGGIGAASFAMLGVILVVACLSCLISRGRKTLNDPRRKTSNVLRRTTSDDSRQQYLKDFIPLKHYSYVQVERITNSFAEVVGKGGFGTVYRGTLCDGRSVAVKILKDSHGNGEDFINEVARMSKTSHVNIVTLLGFCSEGSKRAIIYEFMENGSLDKFISYKKSSNMNWGELYRIALGVARGLEYLHHGCRTRIVHFDIKPQNVLLDDNLCPKVSDFGLARLCEKKESIISLLDTRGTIGYIAPELFSRMYGRVSHKSDVYSYGMLVLEMIGARNKTSTEDSASNPSSMYFPEWIYKDLEKGDNERLIENKINNEEDEIAKKMTLVGLWCIQSSPSDRPPMDRVVEMMEGNVNALEVPPRPVLKQIPTTTLQESSSFSEDISAYTEVCSINVA